MLHLFVLSTLADELSNENREFYMQRNPHIIQMQFPVDRFGHVSGILHLGYYNSD